MAREVDTARCPSCGALLGVPAGFRRGRCPACGALVGLTRARTRQRRRRNPDIWVGAIPGVTKEGKAWYAELLTGDLRAPTVVARLKTAKKPAERDFLRLERSLGNRLRYRPGSRYPEVLVPEPGQLRFFNMNPRPAPRRRNPVTAADVQRAERRFAGFHGVKPRRRRTVKLDLDGQAWWLLGTGKDGAKIEYVPPDYSERAGDIFSHVWGDRGSSVTPGRAKYYISADGKNILIRGGFSVGDRGIVG